MPEIKVATTNDVVGLIKRFMDALSVPTHMLDHNKRIAITLL